MGFFSFSNKIKIRLAQEFLVYCVSMFFLLFTAIYTAHYFGAKITGLVLIVYTLLSIVSNLLSGYYADRIGHKTMMVISGVCSTIAVLALVICNSPALTLPGLSVVMLLVLRACTGLYRPAAKTMLIEMSSSEEREEVFRSQYWIRNVSMMLAAAIGGLTFEHYLFSTLIAIFIVCLMSNVLLFFFIPESLQQKATDKENVFVGLFKSYKAVVFDRLFVGFVTATLLIFTLEVLMDGYIAIRMSKMPDQTLFSHVFSGVQIYGYLNVEGTILAIILTVFLGKLVVKLKGSPYFITGLFMYILGFAVISYATNAWILFAFILVSAIGEIVFAPIYESYLSFLPQGGKVSSYMAFSDLSLFVAGILAPIFVTLSGFFSNLTISVIIFMTGLGGVLMIVLMLPKLNKRKETAIQDEKKKAVSV